MVIAIDAHKIAYMALPKAGCSTVKAALAQVDPTAELPPEAERDVMTWHALYPTKRFRPHRWEQYEAYWRFCVVRDPLKRLLSVYTNRVVAFRDLHNCRKILRGRVDLPMDPDPDFFFQNLRAYLEASSAIKHHILPAWLFLGPDLRRYDRIYRTAELPQFGEDLARRTGQEVHIARENSSDERLDLATLAPATVGALRDYLAGEYDYLSAFFENPFETGLHVSCAVPRRRVS
ncbi:sulfotransferase family protein [Salipiger sp. P9]|uniref:sulfotransferase family protein n=1 Tax=Salipiger pentaromativorans TaxID=2943193 RepID=UPI0021589155|nr:sulfotransferase family protein [Salipiger pentaromativorans]MCR8547322.1 sulfotransferase family protein [Salipiger pentaromativorans]